jgi:hypothetical protein
MVLYRELGIMELDDRGVWIDRPLDEYRCEGCEACPLPPDVPQQWIIDANRAVEEGEQVPPPAFKKPPVPESQGPLMLPPSGPHRIGVPEPVGPAPVQASYDGSGGPAGAAPSVQFVAQRPPPREPTRPLTASAPAPRPTARLAVPAQPCRETPIEEEANQAKETPPRRVPRQRRSWDSG